MSEIEALRGSIQEALTEFEQSASCAAAAEESEQAGAEALAQAHAAIQQALGSLAVYREESTKSAAAMAQSHDHADQGYSIAARAVSGSRHEDEIRNITLDFASRVINAQHATADNTSAADGAEAPVQKAENDVQDLQRRTAHSANLVGTAKHAYGTVRSALEQFMGNL